MRQRTYACAIVLAAVLLCAAAAVHIVRAEAFMAEAGRAAERIVAQRLGTDVHIGAVEIRSLHELTIDDIVIYDKQTEEVLRADRARVTLRLLSLLLSPETSVDEVLLTGAHVHLVRREDGSWNYADLVADDAEPSTFVGRIRIADSAADVDADGHSYVLTDLSGAADIDRGAFSYDASAEFMGIPLRARGEKTSDVQDVQFAADDADLTPLLSLLPETVLPERVKISTLHADRVRTRLRLVDGARTMEGRIDGVRADADLYGTQTTLTSAALRFDERTVFVAATATAAEQTARVDGTVQMDTDAPYLDLRVRANDFAVAEVYPDCPYTGTVSADVRVTGTLAAPAAAGYVTAEGGAVDGVPVTHAAANVAYADNTFSFQNLTAEAFGGNITGEGSLQRADLSYAAHLKVEGLPLDRLRTDADLPLPAALSGTLSADLGIEGRGAERTGLSVFGSAEVLDGMYRSVPIDRANASFFLHGTDLTLDFLSLNLPNDTDLGLEGTVTGGEQLDLRFYGGHVDLSLLNHLDDRLSFAGLSDFSGEVHGDINDPHVDIKVSATKGQLMHQPFDSLLFRAEGSLSGVGIHDFSMERNGREVWLVNGTVGFTGERRIDLQIDTSLPREADRSVYEPDLTSAALHREIIDADSRERTVRAEEQAVKRLIQEITVRRRNAQFHIGVMDISMHFAAEIRQSRKAQAIIQRVQQREVNMPAIKVQIEHGTADDAPLDAKIRIIREVQAEKVNRHIIFTQHKGRARTLHGNIAVGTIRHLRTAVDRKSRLLRPLSADAEVGVQAAVHTIRQGHICRAQPRKRNAVGGKMCRIGFAFRIENARTRKRTAKKFPRQVLK